MPRLDSCLDLDENLLNHLRKIKVFSILDFINVDSEKLLPFLSTKDYLTLKHKLINLSNKSLDNGLAWYKICLKKSAILQTQIDKLDDLLNGGLVTGCLYEISGLSGSGKTQLCFSIAAGVISTLRRKVIYIDSKDDFSAQRVSSILSERHYKDEDIKSFLNRIEVFRVYTFIDILNILYSLKSNFKNSGKYDFRLLIIDSLTVPFLKYVGSQCSNQGFGLLMEVGNVLKQLSKEIHLAVIVTNLAVRYFDADLCLGDTEAGDDKIRPAMGKAWSHVPHTRLLLQHESNNSLSLSILSSNCHLAYKSTSISISSKGVT